MTQQDLGRGLGTDGADASKSVVYGWEKDQHYPRVDQLMLLCKKLNCGADYLLFGLEDRVVSPKFQAAQAAVSQLSDEERFALLTAIQQPGLPDHEVEEKIPAMRKHALKSTLIGNVEPPAKGKKDASHQDQGIRGQGNSSGPKRTAGSSRGR